MSPQRWQAIKELFHAALEQPQEGRSAFVARRCGADLELQREVAHLLQAHQEMPAAPANLSGTSAHLPHSVSGGEAAPPPEFPGLELIEEVAPGVGGMGVVYKAREISLDRVVAVKTTQAHLRTPQGREFFMREARAVARLDHPNILRIHRFNPEHAPPFYVMQYVEGRPLDQAAQGRSPEQIARLVEKIAVALAYAHQRGIIHRDIKPQNILVDYDDEPHIADFGLAGHIEEAPAASDIGSGQALGTPAYVPPEIYMGDSAASPAGDIYALGVTLYLLLTGRLPFAGRSLTETRQRVLDGNAPLPQEINPQAPEPLQRICLKAIERDPPARYESAQAMAEDLRRFREGREVLARPSRYQAELRGRLQNHLTEVQSWHEQKLIDTTEMDRLARPYRALMAAAYPWSILSRRFPWEAVALRTGGWLLIISCLVWLIWYWNHLTRLQVILAIGAPALAVTLSGCALYWRQARVNALIYLSTGALLAPLFVGVALAEYDILSMPQASQRECFDTFARTSDAPPRLPDPRDRFGRPLHHHFVSTNMQIIVAAGVFLVYCTGLLAATNAGILALWVGFGAYLLYSGILLRLGLKEWLVLVPQHIARTLVCYLALAAGLGALSLLLYRFSRTRPWSAFLYGFFPFPAAVCISLLPYYGAVEWIRHESYEVWTRNPANVWMMANGAVYLGIGLWSRGARLSFVRFWGAFFAMLAPAHLLEPPCRMFDRGLRLFRLGQENVTAYELALVILALALLMLGTRGRHILLTFAGLAGLAIFVGLATERHFRDYLAWPLALGIAGVLAMAAAMTSLLLRTRRRHESMI